jgi:cob(I)alamin adenosyltransferase
MKTHGITIILAFLGALVMSCHGRSDTPSVNSNTVTAAGERVTVVEMEPDDELFKSIEMFVKGDYERSSVHIRKAANSMREIALYAGDKQRVAIERITHDLEDLSGKVADNQVHDVASLYHTFRKVAPVLAGYRLNILESEDFNHTEASSGALLKKTIHHLEQTISAYHRALQPEEKAVLNNGLLVAERLEKGDKVSEEELKRTLQTIDHEVVKWNREIEK